jgi:hypothetical protein
LRELKIEIERKTISMLAEKKRRMTIVQLLLPKAPYNAKHVTENNISAGGNCSKKQQQQHKLML